MSKRSFSALIILISAFFMAVHVYAADSRLEITISAAISLKNSFEEIKRVFEAKHKGVKVIFNFGASGYLARQIEGGAPVDVFASAAQEDMDELERKGFVLHNSKVNFAGNSVVLIAPSNSKVQMRSYEDLRLDKITKIAVGNPKTVPAGRYAREVLQYYKMLNAIKDKLIYSENVWQVLDYVARGEVDAGIVYSTDVLMKAEEIRIVATAPEESHKPVVYPIAVVKGTKNERLSREFISLLISQDGNGTLERFGFKLLKQR